MITDPTIIPGKKPKTLKQRLLRGDLVYGDTDRYTVNHKYGPVTVRVQSACKLSYWQRRELGQLAWQRKEKTDASR